ncbi:MAG: hypothetical protein WD431_13170 [Cyclobacteriaceae bacterium]
MIFVDPLNAYPVDFMDEYEISAEVNKPENNYLELLDPVDE